MRKTVEVWTCDICQNATKPAELPPAGWATIKIESPYNDRSFIDKTICPACIHAIDIAPRTK